jgi:hypothetical protein
MDVNWHLRASVTPHKITRSQGRVLQKEEASSQKAVLTSIQSLAKSG